MTAVARILREYPQAKVRWADAILPPERSDDGCYEAIPLVLKGTVRVVLVMSEDRWLRTVGGFFVHSLPSLRRELIQ